MVTIYVDNHPYPADPAGNMLQACLSLGFNLPYFCWHPALGSVGACRQCAVKQFRDAQDTQGRLSMACLLPVAENTRIAIDDPEAKAFRASVIEWLMTSHPHDCPVCDEGGHCHLQDMTVMTGHTFRRYRFPKRTFRNQDLGPFINHEMNRCIQCYRCVRFYRDYAGGRDLDAFASRNHVYFGRHSDGTLENDFSGNLVEICPTGVFTDKTLKQHYVRKWDFQMAPSLCVHCATGCNIIAAERYGTLRAIRNRYNHQVNGYFLCDRGRFGYDFVNSPQRLRQVLLRRHKSQAPETLTPEAALAYLAELLRSDRPVLGIGSPRASLEANYALRTLVGAEHFYRGVAPQEDHLLATILEILGNGIGRAPALHEVEQADAVLVLGEDVSNTAPRLALALRQSIRQQPMHLATQIGIQPWNDAAVRVAVQQEKGPLFLATPAVTHLDDVATRTYRAAPDEIARLGFAVAHALHADLPPVDDLAAEAQALVGQIAAALQGARRPLVIAGTSLGSTALLHAAANVARALSQPGRPAALSYSVPECNSLGLALLGGKPLQAALQVLQEGKAETLIILENDLYRRADAATVSAVLEQCPHVVVLDHLSHATMQHAEIALPSSPFAETTGTLVSYEGRAQRFFQVYVPSPPVQPGWQWLRDLMIATGQSDPWPHFDDLVAAVEHTIPALQGIADLAPPADFRLVQQKIPRQPHRYSGRTAMHAHHTMHEPAPPTDADTPLAFSMEGTSQQPPPALVPFFWAPGWNSIQALNKFQSEVGGELRGGSPGLRLFEAAEPPETAPFRTVPAAFQRRQGLWLLIPLYHIFGSEELSLLAPAVAARAPLPTLLLNEEDAALLQVRPGEMVDIHPGVARHRLSVHIDPTFPRGLAGLPAGWPAFAGLQMPLWSPVTRGEG